MKLLHRILLVAIATIGTLELTSCGAYNQIMWTEYLTVYDHTNHHTYDDISGIPVKLVVKSSVSEDDIHDIDDMALARKLQKITQRTKLSKPIKSFAEEATTFYMDKMHFSLSPSANYILIFEVKDFKMKHYSTKNTDYIVRLTYRLTNEAGETIVPTNTVSANIPYNRETMKFGFGRAYAEALSKVNWDRIADCLRVAKTANQEKNAQVSGAGDTALEHTVIRWYIQSKPQGADVSWRVISSTPDVSNTNSSFVGTTPYESTEAFDIRGLTYNNAGNVQIEVTCEKDGYLPQRKRFNLRQAIDQKEISAKFNLVKDED